MPETMVNDRRPPVHANDLVLCFVTPSLFFISLAMVDTLSPFFVLPFTAAQLLAILQVYSLSARMQLPVRLARQVYVLSLFAIFSIIILGYKIITMESQTHESLLVMRRMQTQLDKDKKAQGKFSPEELERITAHQEMMNALKDPLL